MTRSPSRLGMLVLCVAMLGGSGRTVALDLGPVCPAAAADADAHTDLTTLRSRVDALMQTNPLATIPIICAAIPRAAAEFGEQSVEYARWVASLATPLIAFRNKFNESLPLLETAQPILEAHLGRNAEELADIHVAYAWIYFRQGRLAQAGTAWQRALEIREIYPGAKQIELQKVLVGLAQVRVSQRDFAAARTALDRARDILVANGETASEAGAAIENAYANLAMREEDYAAARDHAQAQIDIEKSLAANVFQLVPAYVLLGRALERLDEFEASEAALYDAIRLAEDEVGPLQRHYLAALTELAELLNDRDEAQRALPFAERAVAVGTATLGDNAPRMVRVLQILADVQLALGNLPAALRSYDRAGAIVAADATDVERATLVSYYRGRGDLETRLGEPAAARAAFDNALVVAANDETLSTERAAVLVSRARTNAHADPDAGRSDLEEALALYTARLPDSHPTILRVVDELCGLELESSSHDTPYCDEAQRRIAALKSPDPSLVAAVFQRQSERATERGAAATALTDAVTAVAAAEALGTPQPLWNTYFNLARVLATAQRESLAIFFAKLSLQQIERQRSQLVGALRRFDRGFLQDKVSVYRACADWLLAEGRIDEGLQVLERLKSQELYGFTVRSSAGPALTWTDTERNWLAVYRASIRADTGTGAALDRLGRLREAERLSVAEAQRLNALLATQHDDVAARAARLGALIEHLGASAHPPPPSSTISAALLERQRLRYGSDAALGVYLLAPDHLTLLIATSQGQSKLRLAIDRAALQRQIGHFLDDIVARRNVDTTSRALYATLAQPLDAAAARANAQRLVLWLDGSLRYLPFAALTGPAGPLLARYTIVEHGETTADRMAASPPLRARAFGVTDAVAGYPALPAVAAEVCALVRGPIVGLSGPSPGCHDTNEGAGIIDGEAYLNGAFTAARLTKLLRQPVAFSVLDLGTHFALRPGNALRSYLVLGDGSTLSLDAIDRLDFRGIELVTLSACQTGLGGAMTDDGREVEALSTIVQRRGARQVIATLWPVEDDSTATLMSSMYRNFVADAADAARALRAAQLELRTQPAYADPYFWAGFVVPGSVDWHPPRPRR